MLLRGKVGDLPVQVCHEVFCGSERTGQFSLSDFFQALLDALVNRAPLRQSVFAVWAGLVARSTRTD